MPSNTEAAPATVQLDEAPQRSSRMTRPRAAPPLASTAAADMAAEVSVDTTGDRKRRFYDGHRQSETCLSSMAGAGRRTIGSSSRSVSALCAHPLATARSSTSPAHEEV